MKFYNMRISNIDRITDESVVLSIEIPSEIKSLFKYIAGQYISLELDIESKTIRRSYSICSAPNEELLQVGIKELKNGIFSSYANKKLRPGDKIRVGEPEGRFILDPENRKYPIMAIAAGSGITPIMSILKFFLTSDSNTSFTLIYGNKSPQKTMFYQELLLLEKLNPKKFKIHWIFSQANIDGSAFGRIDTAFINFAMNNSHSNLARFYICGPESLIKLSQELLLKRGVDENNIFFELFSASPTKSAFLKSVDKGVLKITCDQVTHTLDLIKGKTLLEIALEAKLEVPYSCQGGVCSSCIAKITRGKATMENNQILTDDEVSEGLVLSCQAIAQSQEVYLDFDEA
ncbi:MAG: hypothetical protein CBD39_03985 [Flavobacteriaceae bacterium TMED179]|nr:MAG: hypothetical protein CBD39_03985 [Flavobacteriaceae bacterium TMED179]